MRPIYFDNGASSHPKPRNVYENTFDFVSGNGANAGRSAHVLAMQAAEKIYETRSAICDFFHTDMPENVVFTLNATYALNMVLEGLLRPGDHVITTVAEHNSVLRPLYALQKKGIMLDIADVDLYDDNITVANIARLIRKNTRAIVVTQCSNVCGKMLPIDKIADLKRNGIRLIVDGSQGAGSVPTDFEKQRIDYYCAPFHKGLLGLQGGGFVICRYNELDPLASGGTGGDSTNTAQPLYLPERLEAGTLPIPAICSLLEGLRFLKAVGIESVFAHKKQLVKQMYSGLKKIEQVEVCADYERMTSPGVLAFNVQGVTSEEVGEYLARNGVAVRTGLHCAPLFHKKMGTLDRGMVRITFGFANTQQEIEDFLEILKCF